MYESKNWVVLALLLASSAGSAACGRKVEPAKPAQTAGGEQAAPPPKVDIAALFAAESNPFPVHDLATPDGSLKSKTESATPPTVSAADGFVQIQAKLGDHPLQCFVYPEAKDGGDVIRLMVGATLAKAAPEHRWVDVHGDQAQGWPYVIARAHYFVDGPQGKLAGDFKIAVSVRGETTTMCVLDAPGQYATFERAFRTLISAMDTAGNRGLPKPLKAEIVRTHLPGQMVNIDRNLTYKDGNSRVSQHFSMELGIGPDGSLTTSDDASTKTFRKGRLESGSYASVDNGQMAYTMQLALERRKYKVSGTVQDKPLAGEFEVPGGILDDLRSNAATCEVRDGKKARVDFVDYVPAADPAGPTTMVMQKAPTPDADVQASFGKEQAIHLLMRLDADCEAVNGTIKTGPMTIAVERLWHEKNGS